MEIDTFSEKVKINDQIVFNEDTKQEIKDLFGTPDNITNEYWEMSDETITTYHYNDGAKFDFSNDVLKSFKLFSPKYYLVSVRKLKTRDFGTVKRYLSGLASMNRKGYI